MVGFEAVYYHVLGFEAGSLHFIRNRRAYPCEAASHKMWLFFSALSQTLTRADRQVSHSETSQAFRDKVGKLRSLLATEMLAEPHHFGGKAIVGGAMLSSLLRGVCKAANGGLKNFRPLRCVVRHDIVRRVV